MNIQIDFRTGVPIYIQIMEQIRQMVASGEVKQGDQLPTVRQLATDLRVNFNTIARAYRLLDEAGLISTQQGRGTYIWDKPSQDAFQRLRQEGLDGLTQRYLAEAARLGYITTEIQKAFLAQIEAWNHGDPPREYE